MSQPESRIRRDVPLRALGLSLVALAVPVTGALLFPDVLGEYGALLWLLALIPAFLLAYYRGWRGVATALAAGMATLSCTQAVALVLEREVPDLLLGVVVAYLAIALGIGWVTEVLHRQKDVAEDMAFTDLLTGLPNRRHARVFLENEFAAAERGRLLAVVLFDLDGFKQYNDRYGHQAGDEALQAFAEVLDSTTRRMNLSARFGGEEFISVLAGSEADGAMVYAERVRATLRARNLGDPPLTVSGGVASYHPSMETADDFLSAADRALYTAKHEGRNCVRLFGGSREDRGAAEPERKPAAAAAHGGNGGPPGGGDGRDDLTLLPDQVTGFGAGRDVLLVENEDPVRSLISTYLKREGFRVEEAEDLLGGVTRLRDPYDIVITDIRLPGASGNELVTAAKSRWPETQVIVMTGLQDTQSTADALDARADRFLFKPFGMPELRGHLVEAIARRERRLAEREQGARPTEEARQRAREAREAVLEGAHALARAVEVKEPHARGHCERVARYAEVLSRRVDPRGGLLDSAEMRLACQLHDVGKIEIPDAILNKPGPLDSQELERVREHPRTGRRILDPLLDDDFVLSIVSWHHERWDGSGYPDGLAREAIPLGARIVGIADTLDALTSDRPWRDAHPWEDAVETIRELSGTHFDPDLVEHFEAALPELRELHDALGDGSGGPDRPDAGSG